MREKKIKTNKLIIELKKPISRLFENLCTPRKSIFISLW